MNKQVTLRQTILATGNIRASTDLGNGKRKSTSNESAIMARRNSFKTADQVKRDKALAILALASK